jgi:glutamate-1-semialdehyde 2,1-aminomutase
MKLLHLELIARGQYMARRGYMTLSLPMDDSDVDRFVEAVESVLDTNGSAIRRAVDGA